MLAILAAVMLAAAPQNDTVYMADGGRVIGTVIEESPQGVSIQLPDGTTRRLARGEVARIEYADGSVSTPNRPAPPPQPPAYRAPPAPPPPAYGPSQPPPPAYRPPPPAYRPPPPAYQPPSQPAYAGGGRNLPPLMPFYGSFGIGGLFLSGDAAGGIQMEDLYGSQLGIWLDGGLRLTPHLGLGLYLDVGVGDASSEVNAYCDSLGTDCTATTTRFGVLLRHTFEPYAYSTPWIAVGTGFETGNVTLDNGYGGSNELFSYTGWEMLRLMGGVDLRANPVFGFGLYAGLSLGRYSSYDDDLGDVSIADERTHTTVEAGLRFTLFP